MIRPDGTRIDLEFTQDLVEVIWSWRLDERYELFAGGRYRSLSAEVVATAVEGTRADDSSVQSWVDPIVGARAAWHLGESWAVIGAFDVGGFGVGSDLTIMHAATELAQCALRRRNPSAQAR